ncbi:hypothetical protein DFH09DRAFT_1069507 [Mycena vulgaris]|nr:hypothetical protein DFH09DRAFT_1069507 [Mycena vulgaris]
MRCSLPLIIFSALLAESYALPATSRSEVARRLDIASTQYHATCATYATAIKRAIMGKTFNLHRTREWPNEFTWSGGFYLTPDRDNAVAYGAAFLTNCLENDMMLGGVVILSLSNLSIFCQIHVLTRGLLAEFSFESSTLKVNPEMQGQNFFDRQNMIGDAIKEYLKESKSSQSSLPSQEQIADIRKDTSSSYSVPASLWPFYDNAAPYDVVTGAVPMDKDQQEQMATIVKFGLPEIEAPFPMKMLKVVGNPEPLDPDLAAKQATMAQAYEKSPSPTRRRRELLTAVL